MSYTVIHYFTDLQDNGFEYKVGDVYPRLGKTVTNARLKELSTTINRQGKPLIKLAEEVVEKYTKTEINRMSTEALRKTAEEYGIENATELTGGELKKLLIAKLGL